MIITIHRGSHEIGGTCVEIEGSTGTRILIDIGQPILETGAGPFILPAHLDGVLISHAHQDHYGLLAKISPEVPVYISAPTMRLIEITAKFTGGDFAVRNPIVFKSHQPFTCGEFKIKPYLVDHSAFDAHGFLIEDEKNRIFYSGDFRGHGRKAALLDRFEQYPPSPVDALLLEGTMLGQDTENIITEHELEEAIVAKLKATRSAAFVCVSGQNIDRLVTLFRACVKSGRRLVVDPYVGHVMSELNTFSPNIPFPSSDYACSLGVYYPNRLCRRMRIHLKLGHVLDSFDAVRVQARDIIRKPEGYLVLVRDTMVEELTEKLSQSAENALFLYSLWRGYWDKENMAVLKNWVTERHMDHVYAHTSGHAYPSTLRRLAEALSPRQIIPIHTACPENYGDYFTQEIRIANDGEAIGIN